MNKNVMYIAIGAVLIVIIGWFAYGNYSKSKANKNLTAQADTLKMDNAKKAATIAYQDSVLNKKLVKLDKTDSIQAKKIAKISGQVAAVRNTCTENTAIITAMSISLQTVQKDVADMKGVSEVQVDAADEIVGQPGSLVKPNLGKTQ